MLKYNVISEKNWTHGQRLQIDSSSKGTKEGIQQSSKGTSRICIEKKDKINFEECSLAL